MNKKQNIFDQTWIFLRKPTAKYSVLTIALLSFYSGILFWGGFNTGMEASNQLEFCISCHEMRENVYQEYKKTIHYSNPSGVRAICSDCHVPRDWSHKLWRKIQASQELWGKITGVVDTPEKFEARRLVLATAEWERMKATDSRECRNCHSFEAIRGSKANQVAFEIHMKAKDKGKTCIDCHKGIAHLLPRDYVEPDEE
ncbi:MAG: NapC/NirT family cytochrome c [Sideroxyarcus sp.]